MLLCCVDLVFANAIADKRQDLINKNFSAIPSNWLASSNEGTTKCEAQKPICIMSELCQQYDGTVIDAMVTKAYTWRSVINKYINARELKCDAEFLGLLTIENFDYNLNSLKKLYESYVLSVGEIDEGILLAQIENSSLNQSKYFS